MMLNSERVESELTEAEADLRLTVDRLQQALAEQKRAEESLRESEERYRNFFDTSRDCVFMTTLDGLFVDFNDVALETLGYEQSEREEALGRKVSDFYAHPEERNAHAAMVAEIGFSKEYPIDLRTRDGTIIHTLITTVARKDPSGRIIGFQGTVRDITDLKKAEQALRQSQEMLSLALDGANLGIWDWDLTTGKALWSRTNTTGCWGTNRTSSNLTSRIGKNLFTRTIGQGSRRISTFTSKENSRCYEAEYRTTEQIRRLAVGTGAGKGN